MADNYQTFKVETSNYMGFEYEAFLSQMHAMALAEPQKYYEVRKSVVKYIRDTTIENWFKIYYNALTSGMKEDGTTPIDTDLPPPNFPKQKVTELCLDIAQTVNEIANDICDKIVPNEFGEIAHKRKLDKAAAMGI